MLLDRSEHGAVLADDLRSRGNAIATKTIIGLAKPALAGKNIELVLQPDI